MLDAVPEAEKEFYKGADMALQERLQKKLVSVYGHDLEKVGFSILMITYNFVKEW